MGDSSRILRLTGSPLRYIATVSFDKCKQSLKPVVSISKKIVLPAELLGGRIVGPIVDDDDRIWWTFFFMFPIYCMVAAFINLVVNPGQFWLVILMAGFIVHLVAAYSVIYWYRDMPFQLIGAKVKFMIEVIPMATAAALHHLLEFNYGYLALVLACTSYFYGFAHYMHITYDIGGVDVLLGIGMQVLAYMLNTKLSVRALALSFCFGISFYRYMTYCAPEVPAHRKKELDRLPC